MARSEDGNADVAASREDALLGRSIGKYTLTRVIGRGGRTAKDLRTVISALADGRRVRVDITETDR